MKFFSRLKDTVVFQEVKVLDKTNDFIKDKTGSETTEKVGWILGAAILVGIGVLMLNEKAPGAFRAIFEQATNSIQGLK